MFFAFSFFYSCSRLTDERNRLIKVFLVRWKSYDFTSDGTVRIKGGGVLAYVRAHVCRSCPLAVITVTSCAEHYSPWRQHSAHESEEKKTRQWVWLSSPLLSLSFLSLSSLLLFSCCRPAALLSLLGSKSKTRRLVRCQIFDKSPQCSQRPRTRGQIPQLTKGDFTTRTGLVLCVHVQVRTGAWSGENGSRELVQWTRSMSVRTADFITHAYPPR